MSTSRGRAWAAAAYAAMIFGAIGLFLLVRRYGETLSAPAPSVPGGLISGAGPGTEDVLLHLLIALTAVVIVGRLLGRSVRRHRSAAGPRRSHRRHPARALAARGDRSRGLPVHPAAVGRAVSRYRGAAGRDPLHVPGWARARFRAAARSGPRHRGDLARQHRAAVRAGHDVGPVSVPARLASDVPFTSFALFMGIAMSITAFPVLARILSDLG